MQENPGPPSSHTSWTARARGGVWVNVRTFGHPQRTTTFHTCLRTTAMTQNLFGTLHLNTHQVEGESTL